MYPVELQGLNVLLRELRADDVDAIREYAEDPEVHRYTIWQVDEREDTVAWLAENDEHTRKQPRTIYNLAIEVDGAMIGAGDLLIAPTHQRGGLGYAIRRDRWGQGIVTEAAGLLIRFGFQTLGLHRIFAECEPGNVGSLKVLERNGMRREGLLRNHLRVADRWRDVYVYGLLAHEWADAQGPPSGSP